MSTPVLIIVIVAALVVLVAVAFLVMRRSRPEDHNADHHVPLPSTGEAAPGVVGTAMMSRFVDPPSTPGAAGGPDLDGPTVIRPRTAPHSEAYEPE